MYSGFSWNNENFKIDCRYFIGEIPCKFKRECRGCDKYDPMAYRILIIKLGAVGDVLRTTPILHLLKKVCPQSHITWLVGSGSFDLLKNNHLIDSLMPFTLDNILRLEVERFDQLICFEKEPGAAALAEKVSANQKAGFGLSPYGTIYPLNEESCYAYHLGVSDHLKFVTNKKSYQEIIFEILGMKFSKEEYILNLCADDNVHADKIFKKNHIKKNIIVIGISPGAGSVFANKAWLVENYIQLIELLSKHNNFRIALLGGQREREKNARILSKTGDTVFGTGHNNSLTQFSAIIARCDLVICGDTLPMHIAIALKRYVLALFGPTCPQEIELYNRGAKIVSIIDCAPCYKRSCDVVGNCMTKIGVEDVYKTVCSLLHI